MFPYKTYFLLLSILLTSCSGKTKQLTIANGEAIIVLPDSIEVYHSTIQLEQLAAGNDSYPFKIFTVINVSCSTCLLKLEKWKKFLAQVSKCQKALLVPVCTTKDNFEMFKYLIEEGKIDSIDFPLLLESSYRFSKANKQFENDMSGTSVLTNANNIPIAVGNPLENAAEQQMFIDKICKYTNP